MDAKKLQVILNTAKIGSINKAAEKLGYTQSGLTYLINSIEEEIGISLLIRSHMGISLTDEGNELLPYIEDMIKSEQTFFTKAQQIKSRSTDKITIGAYPSAVVAWIPDALRAFEEKYPYTEVEIKIGSKEINDWLKNDEIHFGIVDKSQAENYYFTPLGYDYMYAAIPSDYLLASQESVTLRQLAQEKMVFSAGNSKNVVLAQFQAQNIKIPHILTVSTVNGMDLLSMVSNKLGVSFISSLYLKSCPDNVRMIPIAPPLKRTIGVISKECKNTDPKILFLLKTFKNYSKYPLALKDE